MIGKILQDKFIKDNFVFFVGSMTVAVLNYLYHPVMSRMMSVEDFGEVQALISLTYLTGIFATIFGTIATNVVANHENTSDDGHVKLLSQLHTLALYVIGFFALSIIILSPFLKDALQFKSAISFVPLILIMLIGIPAMFYNAYFRGVKKFDVVSIAGIITSGGKLVLAITLVFLGWRVFGAISAIALATLCALIYTIYKARGEFRVSLWEKVSFTPAIRGELSYGVLIFFSLGYVTFLYTSDVIMVKYFFDPETAGLYSGIATIARIIFFATASVAGVVLPTITVNASRKENITVLKKAFIIIILMGITALGIFFHFPAHIITILIGEKYLPLAGLLPLVGVYVFLASVTNVLYSYSLALRDRRLVGVSLSGFLVIVGLIIFNHSSLESIVVNYIIGAVLTIFLATVVFVFSYKKKRLFDKNIN